MDFYVSARSASCRWLGAVILAAMVEAAVTAEPVVSVEAVAVVGPLEPVAWAVTVAPLEPVARLAMVEAGGCPSAPWVAMT